MSQGGGFHIESLLCRYKTQKLEKVLPSTTTVVLNSTLLVKCYRSFCSSLFTAHILNYEFRIKNNNRYLAVLFLLLRQKYCYKIRYFFKFRVHVDKNEFTGKLLG